MTSEGEETFLLSRHVSNKVPRRSWRCPQPLEQHQLSACWFDLTHLLLQSRAEHWGRSQRLVSQPTSDPDHLATPGSSASVHAQCGKQHPPCLPRCGQAQKRWQERNCKSQVVTQMLHSYIITRPLQAKGPEVQRVIPGGLLFDPQPHRGKCNFKENCSYLFKDTQGRKSAGLLHSLN